MCFRLEFYQEMIIIKFSFFGCSIVGIVQVRSLVSGSALILYIYREMLITQKQNTRLNYVIQKVQRSRIVINFPHAYFTYASFLRGSWGEVLGFFLWLMIFKLCLSISISISLLDFSCSIEANLVCRFSMVSSFDLSSCCNSSNIISSSSALQYNPSAKKKSIK